MAELFNLGGTATAGTGRRAGAGGALPVKETTTQDFMADVIEASRDRVVVVDFWAPWCGPCKQLAPTLEKAVASYKGAVQLVKLDIDKHPAIPQQMSVQSIPAVFAFKDGRPVDGFMGALPESQILAFLERMVGAAPGDDGGVEEALSAALEAREAGDVGQAAQLYGAILAQDPSNLEALAGLTRCHIAAGNLEQAEHTLALVPEENAAEEAITSARAALELAKKSAAASGELEQYRSRLANNAADHEARLNLAIALNASDDRDGALDALLTLMRMNRSWNDDAARLQLLEFFEAWGPTDPHTHEGRRQLSLLLFS